MSSEYLSHRRQSDRSTNNHNHNHNTLTTRLRSLISSTLSTRNIQIIILCCMWYLSSAVTNNIAKEILQLYKYPVTLSFVQFGIVGFFCFLFGFFTQYTNTSSTTLLPSNSSHHFDKRNRRPSLWKVLTNNVDRLVSLSEPKNLKSIPPRLIGISSVRLALDCVFWGIQITVGYIMKFGRRLAKMIRFWLALGLGLHQTATDDSKVSTLPANSSYFHGTRIRLPSMEIVQTIFPLCLCLIFGHIFGSIALSNVTVSFVHTVKALSPLFTVLIYRVLFDTMYTPQIYMSLLPLTVGVMAACSFEITFNFLGLFCSLASTLIFVVQNIFSKKLFIDEKLDKLNMLLYSSALSFILMSPIWYWSEGYLVLFGPNQEQLTQQKIVNAHHAAHLLSVDGFPHRQDHSLFHLFDHSDFPTLSILVLFMLNGISHFCQNVFAFSILSLVSPVTYSIASLIKRIVVIVVSLLWFGQKISKSQSVGILITFVGLWMYQQAKMKGGEKVLSAGNTRKFSRSPLPPPQAAADWKRRFEQQEETFTLYSSNDAIPSVLHR